MTRRSGDTAKRQPTAGRVRGHTQILVVEDSPTQAEALRALLADAGYDVVLAASGEEGLARFATGEFAVVISDIVMPGAVDGYELCRRIKTGEGRETPVVLLTSLSDPLDIIRGLECGADNFFTKGVEPAYLLERLTLLLTTRETRAHTKLRMGVKVFFLDREFTITSEREQILDLLISTFEDAVRQNRALAQREAELKAAKEELARYAGSLEERLRSVLESVPDVVFSMNVEATELHYVSPASTRVFGLTPAEMTADIKRWRTAIHSDDEPQVAAGHGRAVASGRPETVEYRIRHPDGAERWIEGSFIAVADARGAVVRVDGVARDITGQRKLEEQFRQAQKMEAIGRLAGGVAHDFNNLLTVITSYADILLEDLAPDDPRRGDMGEIQKAAASAAGLTKQLLAFSRQQVLEPRVIDVNAVLADADKLLKRLLGEDVLLLTRMTQPLGTVKADPGQLEQIVLNLAVNARDAMPDGGKLTIETANAEMDEAYARVHPPAQAGRYVLLAVSDTGIGMDERTQRRIFEPFFTTKEVGKGTGLGLATVYGIVKQSGGFIWVYSELGHGTTFKIYLPRVDERAQDVTAPVRPTESLGGAETVLVVEDAPAVRVVTRQVLERLGYTVLEAPNGEAALHLAAKHRGHIDLLLTDVIMPKLGGRQLAERLRELRPGLKVLYTSGYTDDAVLRHGILQPGIAYLQKPFTPDILARKVREVLDSSPGSDASQGGKGSGSQ